MLQNYISSSAIGLVLCRCAVGCQPECTTCVYMVFEQLSFVHGANCIASQQAVEYFLATGSMQVKFAAS